MHRPTALILGLGALVASLCLVVPAPAVAATVVTLDTSTPGHVTGSATTDAPNAYVVIVDNGTELLGWSTQSVAGGVFPFDVETWGLRTDRQYTLRVGACTNAGCTHVDTPFTPTDIAPSVTWPADRTIGPGELASATVSDPGGGGWLQAVWSQYSWDSFTLQAGPNQWYLPDGPQTVKVQRCSAYGCRDTGQSASFFVDRVFTPSAISAGPASVRPDGTPAPDATAQFYVEAPEPVTLDWHLVVPGSGATIPGVGGVVPDIVPVDGVGSFPLDLSGAPDGAYRLVGVMSYDSDDFGHRTADVTDDYVPQVDTTAPNVTHATVSPRSFFPISDGYQDDFEIDIDTDEPPGGLDGSTVFEYVNGAGAVVRHTDLYLSSRNYTVWDGTNQANKRVPAGTYQLRVRLTDGAGNSRTVSLGSVTVSWQRIVSDRVTVRVSAAASEIDRWTGKCSSITKGGSRHQKGALGLVSSSRCSGKAWQRSGVATVHAVRVPAGWRSGGVSVDVIGGAARGSAKSIAVLDHWSRGKKWISAEGLGSRYGRQGTGWVDSGRVVQDDFTIWRVSTALGYRYDVQAFVVTFEGNFLR